MGSLTQKDSRKWKKNRYQWKAGIDNQDDFPDTSNNFDALNNLGGTSAETKPMETNTDNAKSQEQSPQAGPSNIVTKPGSISSSYPHDSLPDIHTQECMEEDIKDKE